MRQGGRGAIRRAWWLGIFTLLLLAVSSVPVLADPSAEEQVAAGALEATTAIDPSLLPDAADLAKAEERIEEEEEARAEELESPAAVAEREESETAYTDFESASAVSDLLRSSFPDELASLEQDPARILTDATLERNLGNDGGAVVSDEGTTELIDAEVPAEVPAEDGDLEKVDLSLNATPEGFESENPTTDVLIPTSPTEPVSIEGGEISIAQVGADPESSAHAFGEKDVIYPEVQTDTDLLVSPRSEGVELFDQLRSPQSPETLSFHLDIPADAELRSSGNVAEIWQDGKMTAFVSPPHAVDAQGTNVPVTMTLQGNTVVLGVAHREGNYAYPMLLDPEVSTQNDWVNNAWYSYHPYGALEDDTFIDWNNNPGLKTSKWCIYACWGSGRGLFVSFPSNGYATNQQAQWAYFVKGETTYLTGYLINPFFRDDHGCPRSSYPEPHDFDGIWSPLYNVYYQLYTNRAPYGNASVYGSTAQSVKAMVFGLNSGNGMYIPCWRDIYAGGVATYMSDPDNPTLDAISGQPSSWFDGSKNYGVNVSAHDKGLGVSNVTLNIEGRPQVTLQKAPCYGNHDSPCPRDMSGTIAFNGANFDEGISTAKVNASDALAKSSAVQSFTAYVDNTAPEITLSGELATVTEEDKGNAKDPKEWDDLSLPVYKLSVKAKDGNPKYTSNKERRSGTKNIEIWIDGAKQSVGWEPKPTPCENCEMTQTYTLQLVGLAAGKHTLKVFASDQMGHKSERDIEFEYIPATGMRDEYVMQYFPLPDGEGNEAEEEHPKRPELAVNVMNGNLVYREKDVDVPGYAADLEVERFYSSQLPDSENTEWGDGWTLAQTPELDPEEGATPKEAELLDVSGAFEDEVQLPTEAGKTKFDASLQASVTKEAGGGYELTDESGETDTSIAFDASGRTDELRTEGYAKIDYDYEGGGLSEIAIKDPASAPDLSEAEEAALEYVPPAPTFKSAFGSVGTGDGQLKAPADIAIAANGDLFVADKTNNRIQRFNQEGKYLSKFGSSGTGNGQFNRPCSIAIDSQGNLYVADANNYRIQKFNEKGEFIKAVGSSGIGNAQFNKPEGIAVDAAGNVFVADTYNQRIQKLNSSLEFISKFGSSGSGNGQFVEANAIDVGPGGKIWVADWGSQRVTQFSESGEYVQQFGTKGSGDGQFNRPWAIEVDSRGNVFVGDQLNNRVEQFNQAGKYLAKFGSSGSGSGQFSLSWPMGMAVDNRGGLWITDVLNNRIQKWSVPNYRPSWYGAFGTSGSGNGQFKAPADIAMAQNGDVWVVDKENNRIEQFSKEGVYLAKVGSLGSGNGQFKAPTSIAIDGSNNLWVTDTGNNRVQKLDEGGQFIAAVGSLGSGDGQFKGPEGIATDLKGNVYVADSENARVEVLDEAGKFLFKFGSSGWGAGKFTKPTGIDIGRHGNIWVADWNSNRVEEFDPAGEFITQFTFPGGTGDGQFGRVVAIAADNHGNLWIPDQTGNRVELFNEAGEYITQFGTSGSGEGQFSFNWPMGIHADPNGGLWITDALNNRVQKWVIPNTDAPKAPEENDPAVEVELSEGLVSSVEGDEAGINAYAYSGDLLTANDGPDGETQYEYDTGGQLKKVTLPNGTWGEITYNTTYGRVSKVTVDPAGSDPAKSTNFAYSEEPRRTTVTPEGAAIITYDIGADGSVYKWQDTKKPPVITVSGSLYASKGKEVGTGVQNVEVKATSPQGISKIQVVANGTALVDERTCEQDFETEEVECTSLVNEWVMETENFPPGTLYLEVIVEDRSGEVAGERFWVNIPQPPAPLPAGLPKRPKFVDVLNFRTEHGLDLDLDPEQNELELNDRVYDSINDWTTENPTARASSDRWGVPLRTPEVSELDYRLAYWAHDSSAIQAWGASHAPSSFAGVHIDERAGGIMRVGFTGDQATKVEELRAAAGLEAPSRITGFVSPPEHSLQSLEALRSQIVNAAEAYPSGLVTQASIDIPENIVRVGSQNTSAAISQLQKDFGSLAPLAVANAPAPQARSGRERIKGSMLAGDRIFTDEGEYYWECTAGFGAYQLVTHPATGDNIWRLFLLTAAHCSPPGVAMGDFGWGAQRRSVEEPGENQQQWLGTIKRTGFDLVKGNPDVDTEAIRLDTPSIAPRKIYPKVGFPEIPVQDAGLVSPGTRVCYSGATSDDVRCGMVLFEGPDTFALEGHRVTEWCFNETSLGGDSGGPVWIEGTSTAVGILSSGDDSMTCFQPLVPDPRYPYATSVFGDSRLAPLALATP